MLIKRPSDIKPSEITDQELYRQRRKFIQRSGLLLTGATLASFGLQGCSDSGAGSKAPRTAPARGDGRFANVPAGPFSSKGETPTEYVDAVSYNNFYEFGTDKSDPAEYAGSLRTKPWSVRVEGECAKPGVYDLEDFLRPHDLEERIYRLRCVEAWSMVIPWIGFSLRDTLKRFEPNSRAKFVAFETLHDPEQMPGQRRSFIDWPYREGLRIDEAMHPLATLAVGMYGDVLPNQNGAPLRLVLPWKYGFKSIKSIVSIRFTETRPETTWNQLQGAEYGFYANVNPAVDHPRWSQKTERRIGEWRRRDTLPFNGYAEQVAQLYSGMDLKRNF
jgi:sulfoxide reductase catalytic subunit YedY